MASPDELIKAGDVAAARAALVEEVRSRPDDRKARMFLSQLLLVLGEWDKALTHMKALANLSPEALTLFTAYDRAVTAEKTREAVFAGKATPEGLAPGGPWFELLLQALAAETKGEAEKAATLRADAFDQAPETKGDADGAAFDFIADADSRFGPAIEAVVDGKYGLIPFETITELSLDGVRDLRDLVWMPARMTLKTGQSGHVFLPVRYPGAATDADSAIRLARKTDWEDHGDLGNHGRGQRVFDAGETEVAILSLRRLTFGG